MSELTRFDSLKSQVSPERRIILDSAGLVPFVDYEEDERAWVWLDRVMNDRLEMTIDAFYKQLHNTYCAPASVSIVLSGLLDVAMNEDDVMNDSKLDEEAVMKHRRLGFTLDELKDMIGNLQVDVEIQVIRPGEDGFSDESDMASIVSHVNDPSACVLMNYSMSTLGQGCPYGHFSPIVAAHDDHLLLLDVWPQTEVVWAPISNCWKAVNTTDSDSGKLRGFLIIKSNQVDP